MTKREFRIAMQKMGLDADALAYYADVSIPTAEKWLSGESAPHEYMRAGVIANLKAELWDEVERENGRKYP